MQEKLDLGMMRLTIEYNDIEVSIDVSDSQPDLPAWAERNAKTLAQQAVSMNNERKRFLKDRANGNHTN